MRTRLTDLAKHAGVSTATVSRVLNGKPGVSAETRQAVLTALDVLGYERPDKLQTKNAGLIGLVVPELENPVFPLFAQAIESTLSQHGYTPLLCSQSPGGTSEDEYITALLGHEVDGIIFVSGLHADTTANRDRYHRLRSRGLPIALINGYASDIDAPFISSNDAASIDLSIEHLVQLGHRKIGLAIGPERFVPAQRKIMAFTDNMARRFGPAGVENSVEVSLFTVEGGQAASTALIGRGHTAIICGSDMMALGAMRAARTLGLEVPADVSIIGYDDSLMTAFTDPPLTTVRQQVASMSAAAVNAILSEIQRIKAPRTELLFEPELIVRGSTAAVTRKP